MQQDKHPDYHSVVFRDRAAGYAFLTRSTATSDQTIEWDDGETYRSSTSRSPRRATPSTRARPGPWTRRAGSHSSRGGTGVRGRERTRTGRLEGLPSALGRKELTLLLGPAGLTRWLR